MTADLSLLLITDRRAARRPLAEAVRASIRGGVTAVMLRERDLDTAALIRLGRDIVGICRDAGVTIVINHDVRAACELGADGVHLGYRSVGVAAARAELGSGAGTGRPALVGRSTHDPEELRDAWQAGADYVTYGPIFDTPSKRGLVTPCGVTGVRAAVAASPGRPVVALGGIEASTVADVRGTGVAGVAAIRALLDVDDETVAAERLAVAWRSA